MFDNTYKLVFSDEFEGSGALDESKWNFADCMRAYPDMPTDTTSDVVNITEDSDGNSVLRLTAYRTKNGEFKAPKSVTTSKKMTFVYGYLEIRAKVPIGNGVWPSFWLLSNLPRHCGSDELAEKLGYEPNGIYNTEIDIFEVFADKVVVPNIHKWWEHETKYYAPPNTRVIPPIKVNRFDISDNGWHTYGMLWTPQEISLYVDRECYMTYNLNDNFGPEEVDMSGFHKPHFIIFNNHLFTPGYAEEPDGKWSKKYDIADETFKSAVYDIDYVRLYQKPNESKIYFAE